MPGGWREVIEPGALSGGTVLTDLNPLRRDGVALGYEQRWLFPVLPTTAVSDATTSIQYLSRAAARSRAPR